MLWWELLIYRNCCFFNLVEKWVRLFSVLILFFIKYIVRFRCWLFSLRMFSYWLNITYSFLNLDWNCFVNILWYSLGRFLLCNFIRWRFGKRLLFYFRLLLLWFLGCIFGKRWKLKWRWLLLLLMFIWVFLIVILTFLTFWNLWLFCLLFLGRFLWGWFQFFRKL